MLVKVNAELATCAQIHQTVDVFRAKVVDMMPDSMTIEITEKKQTGRLVSNLVPLVP